MKYFLMLTLYVLSKYLLANEYDLQTLETIADLKLKENLKTFFINIKNQKQLAKKDAIDTIEYKLINYLKLRTIEQLKNKVTLNVSMNIFAKEIFDYSTKTSKIHKLPKVIKINVNLTFIKKNSKFILEEIPDVFPIKYIKN